MVHFILPLLAFSTLASGAPMHSKRIAQTIADSTTLWVKACTAAGGAEQCNPISVTAFSTLLAAAGPCDQQNSADAMIDLAKTLNSDADMIKFAQIFAQQPRNTPTSQAVPYCQSAPKNAELDGLFQCQFQGSNQQTFVGGLALGANGTVPFGHAGPLATLGACAAHSAGPIADGTQLTDTTQDPGLQNIATLGGTANSTSATNSASTANSTSAADNDNESDDESDDSDDENDCDDSDSDESDSASTSATSTVASSAASVTSATASITSSASSAASATSSAASFKLQNALDAQKLNAQFATLTAASSCNEGDMGCIDGGFAQCVGGKYVNLGCSASLQCFALPLVNTPGTSIACTTTADAAARIAAPGATGGITGSD